MSLLLLLLFPVAWPFISKLIWPREINMIEVAAQVVVVGLLVTGIYYCGKSGKTSDTEIHNGMIQAKHRQQGSYIESYQCNCYTTYSGTGSNRTSTTVCSTCYRDHYTVDWYLDTSIGKIDIDSKDWTSRAVYLLPNPGEYDKAYVGEGCSGEFAFTNYVKAVPESLFGAISKTSQSNYPIPTYPRVFDKYHINRVINVGSNVNAQTLTDLNAKLQDANKTLGPTKQANIIVIVTNISNSMYRYAVENAWLGGKKNDIVVFIGSKDGHTMDWVDVMTWAMNKGNGQFHSTLKDDILEVGDITNTDKLVEAISSDVAKLYSRPHMKDFEYLDKEISPPTWVLILAFILSIVLSVGSTIYFKTHADEFNGGGW